MAGLLAFAAVAGVSAEEKKFKYPETKKVDQVDDYHVRKGMTVAEVERWLGPNLGYDPGN